jgi:phosphotransferase system HPr (HPr) family protein
MAIEKEIVIANKYGLHARPAMEFVQLAKKFGSSVRVEKAELAADGKSILEIMTLGAERGSKVRLVVKGEDEARAAAALENLLVGSADEQ